MARICIVTPGQLGSNPRVAKEADALTAAGHQVHVVAIRQLALVEPRDLDVIAKADWSVERVAFDRPRIWKALRLRQMAAQAVFRRTGHLADLAISPATPGLTKAAMRWPADLYIAHYVPALPAAARAAARHGARLAFDAEDFHYGDLPDRPEHQAAKALIHAIEGRYLPGCANVTASSPGIAEAYAATYGIATPKVVLNTFPAAGVSAPAPRRPDAPPSLYWVSQTIGRGRGLECAVRAIAQARTRPHLHVRGAPSAGFVERLSELAEEVGASGQLHIYPPANPSEMIQLAAEHDLGLVGEIGETPNRRIVLSNKQFIYLLAGVPAVMSDIPSHRAFAAQAPGATAVYAADDPVDLARVLDDLLSDPNRLAAARAEAFRLGQTLFNWEVEQTRLVASVEAALA